MKTRITITTKKVDIFMPQFYLLMLLYSLVYFRKDLIQLAEDLQENKTRGKRNHPEGGSP